MLINRLPIFQQKEDLSAAERVLTEPAPQMRRRPGSKGILVGGLGDMMVRLSKCCNPIFGDAIVGYITRGRGVSVHRADCPNLTSLCEDENRQVEVSWDEGALGKKDTFLVEIQVHSLDRPNVLLRVTNIISQFKINIRQVVPVFRVDISGAHRNHGQVEIAGAVRIFFCDFISLEYYPSQYILYHIITFYHK